jgi:hypothetical protein
LPGPTPTTAHTGRLLPSPIAEDLHAGRGGFKPAPPA